MERARQDEIGTAGRPAQTEPGGPAGGYGTGSGGSGGPGTLGGATAANPSASQSRGGTGGTVGTPAGGTHSGASAAGSGQTGGSGAGTGEPTTDQAGAVAEEARDAVGDVVGAVQRQASSRLSEQFGRTSERLGGLSTALHAVGRELREQDDAMAGWVDRAADQVQQLSGYLRGKDLDTIVEEAESFARRQPALFLGGAFVLGLAAARFLKSAAPPSDGWRAGYGPQGRRPRPYPGMRSSQPGYGAPGYGAPRPAGYAAGRQPGYGAPVRRPESTASVPTRPASPATRPTGPSVGTGTPTGGTTASGGTSGSPERTSGL